MSSVIEQMPEQLRDVFVEVLEQRDSSLLAALRNQQKPTPEQRQTVDDIFSNEVVQELGPGWAPSARGQLIKRAIEEFWYLWPSDVPL